MKKFVFIDPRTAKELRTLLLSLYSENKKKKKTITQKPRELSHFFQWYAEMSSSPRLRSQPANQVIFFTYHNFPPVHLIQVMEIFPYEIVFKT